MYKCTGSPLHLARRNTWHLSLVPKNSGSKLNERILNQILATYFAVGGGLWPTSINLYCQLIVSLGQSFFGLPLCAFRHPYH